MPIDGAITVIQGVGGWDATYCGNHLGQDLRAGPGTAIRAIANGRVARVWPKGISGIGYPIHVEHTLPDGSKAVSVYYHTKRIGAGGIELKQDQEVKRGEVIGYTTDLSKDWGGGPHLHIGIRLGAYNASGVRLGAYNPLDDARTLRWFYPGYTSIHSPQPNSKLLCDQADPKHVAITAEWEQFPLKFITDHPSPPPPPISASRDIWTTSVFSFTPAGGGPGGGLDDDQLVVGGWGDEYRSLLQFDISSMAKVASSATLRLYDMSTHAGSNGSVAMYIDQVTSSWDWTTQPTGTLSPDNLRLWWVNRPTFTQLNTLPAPTVGGYYDIDITTLYNQWQSGAAANFGVQLRPVATDNFWDVFASSNNTTAAWRPKLIVVP